MFDRYSFLVYEFQIFELLRALLFRRFKCLLRHHLIKLNVDPLIDWLCLWVEALVGLVEDLIGRLHQHLVAVRALLKFDDVQVWGGVRQHWDIEGGQDRLQATVVATQVEGSSQDWVKVPELVNIRIALHYFKQIKTVVKRWLAFIGNSQI